MCSGLVIGCPCIYEGTWQSRCVALKPTDNRPTGIPDDAASMSAPVALPGQRWFKIRRLGINPCTCSLVLMCLPRWRTALRITIMAAAGSIEGTIPTAEHDAAYEQHHGNLYPGRQLPASLFGKCDGGTKGVLWNREPAAGEGTSTKVRPQQGPLQRMLCWWSGRSLETGTDSASPAT